MRSRTLAAPALLIAITAGCATGKKVDADNYRQLEENRTTKTELIDLLGPPTSTGFAGSDEILNYQSSKTDATTYIPFAGMFLGGNEMQICTFRFNTRDVLTSKTCTGAASGNRVLSQ